MVRNFNSAMFHNESKETRGTELEKVYSGLLGGKIVGGHQDGGIDIVFEDNPDIPLVQIKSSWPIAQKFLSDSVKFKTFIPIIVGDPGQHTREEILESIIEKGGWAGVDVDDREKIIEQISQVRELILDKLKGVQKGF